MEKLNRFTARHQGSCRIIMVILWILWALLVMDLGFPKVLTYILMAVGIFVFSIAISISGDRLLKKPLEILNQQCDPYPLLQETTEQLGYRGTEAVKQVRNINYAMALRHIGEYSRAEMLLRSINIDKYALAPITKVVYYNNLMDICVLTGNLQEARIWYEKTVRIFSDIKDGKQKKALARTVAQNRAWYCFAGGEYEQALQTMEMNRPENLLQQIEAAMLCGCIYLEMGRRDQAEQALQFAAHNGNKLYAAQKARNMLEEMTKTQENGVT